MKKRIKTAASWLIFLVGCLAFLELAAGIVLGVLKAAEWMMDATIGWWLLPACLVLFVVCVVGFFALNPIKAEEG